MRSLVLVGLVLMGVGVSKFPSVSDAGSRDTRCRNHGARTLLRSREVYVYGARRRYSDDLGGPYRHKWSCVLRTGHVEDLDDVAEGYYGYGPPRMAVVGYRIAYATDTVGQPIDPGTSDITIFDARKDIVFGAPAVDDGYLARVGRVVMARDGAFAWTSCVDVALDPCPRGGDKHTVYAHPAGRGDTVRLERAPGIDIGSLRLQGRTLSWSNGGVRRTAALP